MERLQYRSTIDLGIRCDKETEGGGRDVVREIRVCYYDEKERVGGERQLKYDRVWREVILVGPARYFRARPQEGKGGNNAD